MFWTFTRIFLGAREQKLMILEHFEIWWIFSIFDQNFIFLPFFAQKRPKTWNFYEKSSIFTKFQNALKSSIFVCQCSKSFWEDFRYYIWDRTWGVPGFWMTLSVSQIILMTYVKIALFFKKNGNFLTFFWETDKLKKMIYLPYARFKI